MKDKLGKLLNTVAIISSGGLLSSLFLMPNDAWKIYLVVFSICVSFKNCIYE